jgi:tetratricopeptide (TPR) repeat protein
MTEPASQPTQIALQNVTANEIRIGNITQTINYTQRQVALGSVVNEGLPPLPSAEIWQERDEEGQLREWLMGGKLRLVGLEGAGGYGKSATAAKVCKTDLGFDRAPLWVNFQIPITFGTFARWIIRKLAGEVLYDQMRETYERLSDAELVEKVLSDLTETRCLLVMDNLETLFQSEAMWGPYGDFLDGWLGRSGGGCVLLTSQYRLKLPMAKVWKWVGLRGLTLPQGVALLQGEGVVGDLADLAAFVEAADGHPLLLTLAVNLLKQQEEEDLENPEILRLGKSAVATLWEIVEMHRGDGEASVGKVLDASFERLYPEWLRVLLWRSSVLRVSFGLDAAQSMVDESVELSNLRHLARWSFLQEEKVDGEWLFNFLPLIARYLQLGATEQQQLDIAHKRAIGYYEANYREWDGTIESCRSELEGFYHACELGQYDRAYRILARCDEMLDRDGQWPSLLLLYDRLTREWKAADETEAKNLGSAWTRSGNLRQNMGDYPGSIDDHLQAQVIFDRLNFPEGTAGALGNLGNAYYSLGDYQKAIDFHSQHNEMAQAIGDKQGIANSLGNLGLAYDSLGDYQKAIDFYSQCMELAQAIGDKQGIAKSLGNLGLAYQSLGDYQKAIDFHSQSMEMAQAIVDKQGIAASLGNLGLAYQSLGDYQKAIDFHSQSMEMAQAIVDKQGIARSLGNLGLAYDSLGDYQKAIDFHSQSMEIKQEIGDKQGIANSLGGLGLAYDSLGDYQKAIDFHSQSMEIKQEIGDKQGIANSLGGLGIAYYSLGDYQKAIDFHSQSNELAQAIGDKQGISNSLGNLGVAYYSLGDYQKAIDFHSQSMEIKQAIGDRRGMGASLNNIAGTWVKIDDHFNALQYLKQAKAIYEELKLDHMVKQCQNNIEVCTRAIATQRRTPPTLDDSPDESTIDWYEKQRQLNQPKTYTVAELSAMNRKFFLWFCVGIAIVLVIAWLKK